MKTSATTGQITSHLSEYLKRIAEDEERLIIEEDGVPKAALVSLADLRRLEPDESEVAPTDDLSAREAAFRRDLEADGLVLHWATGPRMTAEERHLLPPMDPPLSEQIIAERR